MNSRPTETISLRLIKGCLVCLLCFGVSTAQAGKPKPAANGNPAAEDKAVQQAQKGKKQPKKCQDAQKPKSKSLFDGKTMGKWAVVKKYDFQAHGPIKVRDGAISIGAGSPASGIRWTGKMPRNNYQISLEAMRTEGSDFFCGMTFPVKKSYCTLIIGGWGGTVIGLSNINDEAAAENESCTMSEFKNNRWYKIRLRVTSAKIEAWIDKEKVIDQTTTDRKFSIWWEQEPMRPLGIATWVTGSAVKNIKLEMLGKKELAESGAKKAGAVHGKK